MIHSFETEDAAKYGLVEAVMLNNFRYWIAHNKANGAHQHDGKTWTYNSVKAFETLFPYLTGNQIRRCLESLVTQGVLVRGNYNSSPYDKTSWFAFSDESFCLVDVADLPIRKGDTAQSEADIKTTTKTKTTTTRETVIPENFEPNETAVTLANETGVSIAAELPAFTDHHTANGSTFKDWQAAFRTWIRKSAQFAKRDQRGRPSAMTASNRQTLSFAERDRIAGMQQWEAQCNQRHPDLPAEFSLLKNIGDVIDMTPENRRISK